MIQNVWTWPWLVCYCKCAFWGTHLIKLTTCLRPNIVNILFTSVNEGKLINFMNPTSDELHIWFTVPTSKHSFKNMSGMVQIKK